MNLLEMSQIGVKYLNAGVRQVCSNIFIPWGWGGRGKYGNRSSWELGE